MDNKLTAYINKICMATVKAFGMAFMIYLFLLSIFSTSVRSVRNYGTAEKPEWGRYTYFLPDSPVKHLCVILLFIIVLWAVERLRSRADEKNQYKKWRKDCGWRRCFPDGLSLEVICGVYFLTVLLYILNTQFLPKSDPAVLLQIADEILNQDFHEFEKEGYMYRYPYQSGFVFLCMAAIKLSGAQAYLFLQVINAVSVTAFFYLLGRLMMLWWGYGKRQTSFLVLISMLCSLPLFLYVTFVYGNLPGMAMSVAAVYFLQIFLNERKFCRLFWAAICISIAAVLKSNCLIVFVAMVIVLIWDGFRSRERKGSFAAVLFLLICLVLGNQGVTIAMETVTGQEASEGMPKSALIAMGLEEGTAGPGTESGSSNRIYEENNYQYEMTDSAAKEQIKVILKGYRKNPPALVSFFARKQALQCNEPTFQSFSISGDRDTEIKVPEWLSDVIAGKGSLYLAEIMNRLHAVILFGVCVYIFALNVKKPELNELIFLIVFIGCFLFQMFYEAKSQYMLIFFFMLLPYAMRGYGILLKGLNGLTERENRNAVRSFMKRNKVKGVIVAVTVCLIAAAGIWTGLFAHTICLRSSEELIQEYYEVIHTRENPNG